MFIDFYGKAKKRSAVIRNNRNYFVDNIKPTTELIAALLSHNCITEEQAHFIQRQRYTRDKNDTLLYVMESVDETYFSCFVTWLQHTNQKTVAKIMENGGGFKYKLSLTGSLPFSLYPIACRNLLKLIYPGSIFQNPNTCIIS